MKKSDNLLYIINNIIRFKNWIDKINVDRRNKYWNKLYPNSTTRIMYKKDISK